MKKYQPNELDKLVKILKNNGVICVPTDTVYGLCACMDSKIAHNNLIKIKNRPANKLFPIMCADEEQIKSIAIVNDSAKKLIKAFMPGPITLILKKKKHIPKYVNNSTETIAIRMATSKTLKDLITKLGSPIFLSSANQSGEPTCSNIEEIEKSCPNLDGILLGNVSFNKASTIVDCSSDKLKILRLGPITIEDIEKVLEN